MFEATEVEIGRQLVKQHDSKEHKNRSQRDHEEPDTNTHKHEKQTNKRTHTQQAQWVSTASAIG
jgi:hypothetical protein